MEAGSYLFSVNPSPCGERLHLVGADPIDQPIEMLADARLGPPAVGRLEQHVDGAVELLLGAPRRVPVSSSRWPALKCASEAAISVRTGSSDGPVPASGAGHGARRPEWRRRRDGRDAWA